MRPLLVLFDVDGTLVSAAGAGRRALEDAFRAVFGLDGIGPRTAEVRFEGRTDPLIVADMARAVGLDPADVERRVTEFRASYLGALRAEMKRPDPRRRVLPGVVPLLDALRATPAVHLGLITGNIEEGARAKLEPFGLNPYFPDGGFSSDHSDRGEIARIAREKISRRSGISFPPDRVTVVGDTDQDVACARANGFRAIVVESGFVPFDRLVAAAPDALFRNLTEATAVMRALGVE